MKMQIKKFFTVCHPAFYAVATVCICIIIAVAAVMSNPEENVISADTTEGNNEATTCEEVWGYIRKDALVDQAEEDYEEEVSTETEKVLLVTSEGKHLIGVEYVRYTKSELREKFEEKYGFEYDMYWNDTRLIEEGCAQILGHEYEEGDEYNEKVIAFKMKIANDLGELRRELNRERAEIILEDCGYSFEDVHSFEYFLLVYVNEEDIETINNHELVKYVMVGQNFLDSLMIKLEEQ